MKFQVKNRFSGEVQFEATIKSTEDAGTSINLGLAIRWALKNKIDLTSANLTSADLRSANLRYANLTSADLRSANLTSADLTSANLTSADLRSANLTSANLRSANLRYANLTSANLTYADLRYADLRYADLRSSKIKRVIAILNRLDGYTFYAFETETDGVKVLAGCRWFAVAEYRAHITLSYPETPKAVETISILDFIERRAKEMGAA